jgi:hypothetical protein
MFQNKILLSIYVFTIAYCTYSLSTGDEIRKQPVPFRILFTVFSIGFVAVSFVGLLFVLNLLMVLASKHVGQVGLHTLEIKDEGLEESTAVNKGLHRWNPSFRIKEFGNYVWIYPTDGQYFLIPKRQGGHEGDLSGFLAQLKAKIN